MGWFFNGSPDEMKAAIFEAGEKVLTAFGDADDNSQPARVWLAVELADSRATVTTQFMAKRIRELHEQHDAEIAGLTKRLEALEEAAPIVDKGTWRDDQRYPKGSAVSRQGALWISRCATSEKPGSSNDWRLSVKSGRVETRGANYLTRDLTSGEA